MTMIFDITRLLNPARMLYVLCLLTLEMSSGLGQITTQHFLQEDITQATGQIHSDNYAIARRLACSQKCLTYEKCKGILFNSNADISGRCKVVLACDSPINHTNLIGYQFFSIKQNELVPCLDLAISVPTPVNWSSPCPTLYFPLDSMNEGIAMGNNPSAMQFVAGVVNNSLSHPNPSRNSAYFHLGFYPSTEYCFPDPERCTQGVSFAFWLKLLGPVYPGKGVMGGGNFWQETHV